MKIILLQSIKNIGQKGEVKEVSEGYYRNFLLPRNLALVATDKQVTHIQSQKAKSVEKLEGIKESAHLIKDKIEGQTITLKEKSSEAGTLYRAINEKIIAELIKDQLKAIIPASSIILAEHFKNTGTFQVKINLFKGVDAHLNLKIE